MDEKGVFQTIALVTVGLMLAALVASVCVEVSQPDCHERANVCLAWDEEKVAAWLPQCIQGRAASDEYDYRVANCESVALKLFCTERGYVHADEASTLIWSYEKLGGSPYVKPGRCPALEEEK